MYLRALALSCFLLAQSGSAFGAEIVALSEQNWKDFTPQGKEVDCILGDFALKSDRLLIVVAQPGASRNANMTVRQVGGAVIDMTEVNRSNDQLSAFYPGRRLDTFDRARIVQARGKSVKLVLTAPASPGNEKDKVPARPAVSVEYELQDGSPFLIVRSRFTNTGKQPLEVDLEDDVRADGFDKKVKAGETDLFYVHDHFFEQAYGLTVEKHAMRTRSDARNSVLSYAPGREGPARVTLEPGASHELERRLFAGADLLAVKGEAERAAGKPVAEAGGHFVDSQFKPLAGIDVTLKQGDAEYGTARTDVWGWVKAPLPPGKYTLDYRAPGRGVHVAELDLTDCKNGDTINAEFALPDAPVVEAEITDEKGGPIPCKVEFKGVGETTSPNWGPPAARQAVVNLFYSENGRFRVPINQGTYEVIISHGPEYDVVRMPLKVEKAGPVALKAQLKRAFETPGWVSSDFHSHSSPSGDNTGDQRGRVLNLLAEHIEFAPCTEHNRLSSYTPHLRALKAEKLMGTCVGMELTGTPLPLNHQNAFPLILKPRTQDQGAPVTDVDPQVQIRRLLEWDDSAEKLVQQNHPDIGWLFYDKNGDGKPDGGYKDGFACMHVIEVHPIHSLLTMEPHQLRVDRTGKRLRYNHTVFNWLQLINQGHRIWGVVNTDAHYNFHGSGGLRNYVQCPTEEPGDIDPLHIVRECKKGHIIMTTAPYMQVKLNGALPGDDLMLKEGKADLSISVHCANWYDIDRVQVLLNGKPEPSLNFTRESHPALFTRKALRFQHRVVLSLKEDAHVIVVAVGDEPLGEVIGPLWGRANPTAISNPIFVDVDGGGFKPNGDTLGVPLPTKGGTPVR